jgi:hypothetical protein
MAARAGRNGAGTGQSVIERQLIVPAATAAGTFHVKQSARLRG